MGYAERPGTPQLVGNFARALSAIRAISLEAACVALLVVAGGAQAQTITFDVSLEGYSVFTDHFLTVTGTIDADAATNTLISSSLVFTHDYGLTFPLGSGVGGGEGVNFEWDVSSAGLFFKRLTTSPNSFVSFAGGDGAGRDGSLILGTGNNSVNLQFFTPGIETHMDVVFLQSGPHPIGSTFLLGTAPAPPPPPPVVPQFVPSLGGLARLVLPLLLLGAPFLVVWRREPGNA